MQTLLGVAAAQTPGRLGLAWFDALARYPSQIEALEWAVNSRRSEAAAMAKSRGASHGDG